MSDWTTQPLQKPIRAQITPPGSKSLTNRALVLAAIAMGRSTLSNVLVADDTQVMLDGLQRLGFALEIDIPNRTVLIQGGAGDVPAKSAELFCGNSGTTIRFLSALCALGHGDFTLDGVPRMRQRPIGELTGLLRDLGVRTKFLGDEGFPPIAIHADGLPGGLIKFGAAQSSQFLSAVLIASPAARHEVRIDLIDKQTSWPYVAMTMQLMDQFGVTPELIRDPLTHEPKCIIVPQGNYRGRKYVVEPDASNASYFLGLAAIHPGSHITVGGLGKSSLQGDVAFANVLQKMGAKVTLGRDSIEVVAGDSLAGIDVDLSEMPDTAQTLAVVALFADGRSVLRGLQTLRVKETDRLAALASELTKLGATIKIEGDALLIDAPLKLKPAHIATYDDHRMAMSFSLAATRSAGVVICDAECVNKTYPEYFQDLERVLTPAE